jgi:hypothetical protein
MLFSAASYPTAGLFAAAKALECVYDAHANDEPVEIPLYAFQDFVEMTGFQQIWDFERKTLTFCGLRPPTKQIRECPAVFVVSIAAGFDRHSSPKPGDRFDSDTSYSSCV